MLGNNLDLSSDGPLRRAADEATDSANRRYVGVRFQCCDLYCRAYLNDDRTAYEGRCPRCGKRIDIRIGPGGTDARFFTAF